MLLFSRLFLALLRCFLIETYGSFWRTMVYCYTMLTAASCSTSGLCTVFLSLTLHIYIYICSLRRLIERVYIAIYAYMQGIYAYIEPVKYIYRPYIYVCHVYLCVYVLFACCIYANECKLVQMYTPLHIIWYLSMQYTYCYAKYQLCSIGPCHPWFTINRLCLHLCNYYRRFIHGFAELAHLLIDLTF